MTLKLQRIMSRILSSLSSINGGNKLKCLGSALICPNMFNIS
jgi:hypothetical protein